MFATGRPLRVVKNKYIMDWEENRQKEMKELLQKGTLPYTADVEARQKRFARSGAQSLTCCARAAAARRSLRRTCRRCSRADRCSWARPLVSSRMSRFAHFQRIRSSHLRLFLAFAQPAAQIIKEMVEDAISILRANTSRITTIPPAIRSKL